MSGGGTERQELLERMRTLLADQRGIAPELVTEDARLDDDLHLDSLALTEVGFLLFTEGVGLDDAAVLTAQTVGDVLDEIAPKPGA
ncbi:phosphopantetheine-binding protein [Streptomyces boncukensis]|uniref:Acyl carrier protein n=1 Tax=Streptomyces boncukensis TaxID=2711219 RepID=A0A6G4WQN9_9ACTN|nr:phosphopantetheine-binding protein [Streptomyces boncukensis]NGO66874.1 acyl carrier protein [Streptomyces boncukensis]